MNLYLKIVLILFGLAYLISPLDIIPDLLLPFVGWIDDGLVLGTIVYLIRYGRLPNFLFKRQHPFKQSTHGKPGQFDANRTTRNSDGPDHRKGEADANHLKTPFEILGVHPSASKKEIQVAYKAAIKKYHPDKLSHLGDEFSTLANKKFLEIQKAYTELMDR